MPDDVMHPRKFYALVHPGAPRGIVTEKPRFRKQDKRADSVELYAVVFFPKISGLGKASVNFYGVANTLSQTPEAAITKFLDGIALNQTWETYHDAGHRVRRIRISDLGDAVV